MPSVILPAAWRRILGHKKEKVVSGGRRFRNEELKNFQFSLSIIRVITGEE
jgi:hypothetical protein